ncbi:LysR family transcriptional regulator [Oleidesulfovibrio alaskensis]
MLEYRLIEALAMVVREGGFEKAARVLHVTQSAVSQRIRQLEAAAGTALVTRAAPVTPTEAGRRLLRHYHQVSMLEADLERDMAARFSAELLGEGGAAHGGPRLPAAECGRQCRQSGHMVSGGGGCRGGTGKAAA